MQKNRVTRGDKLGERARGCPALVVLGCFFGRKASKQRR